MNVLNRRFLYFVLLSRTEIVINSAQYYHFVMKKKTFDDMDFGERETISKNMYAETIFFLTRALTENLGEMSITQMIRVVKVANKGCVEEHSFKKSTSPGY